MTVFATALATLHADPNLGEAAHFRRPPYTWQAVTIIRQQPNDLMGNARAGALLVDVLASEVADLPMRGDEIRIGSTVYRVEDAEPDALGLSYRCTLGT